MMMEAKTSKNGLRSVFGGQLGQGAEKNLKTLCKLFSYLWKMN